MKKSITFTVSVIFLAVVAVITYSYVTKMTTVRATQAGMQFILDHTNYKGDLIDYNGEIRMKNPDEDIRLFVKDNKVTIRFGVIEMHWTADQFMDPANIENLSRIYITVRVDEETNRLTVYYKGREIRRWVS